MKTSLLTTVAVFAILTAGAAGAQPTQGRGRQDEHGAANSNSDQRPGKDRKGGEKAASPSARDKRAIPSPPRPASQGRTDGVRPARQSGITRGENTHPQARPVGRPEAAHTSPAPRPAFQQRAEDAPTQTRRPERQVRTAPPALSVWRAPARGPSRDRMNEAWRQQNHNRDRSAPWRQNHDWWRNDSGFRLFVGPRVGFFFVPQRGYIALPERYRDHQWRAGDYLPTWFRGYPVSNYDRYGLPRPPRGCVWIWLNGAVGLVDRADGYILDVVHNVW